MEISVTETKGKFTKTKAGPSRRSVKLINFYQTDGEGWCGIRRNDVSMSKSENEITLNIFQKLKENRLTDIENRLRLPRGRGDGKGWTGSLGLTDANCYL